MDESFITHATYNALATWFIDEDDGMMDGDGWCTGTLREDIGPVKKGKYVSATIDGNKVTLKFVRDHDGEWQDIPSYTFSMNHRRPKLVLPEFNENELRCDTLISDLLCNFRGEDIESHTAWLWDIGPHISSEELGKLASKYLRSKGKNRTAKRVVEALKNPDPREPGWSHSLVNSGILKAYTWYDITCSIVRPHLSKLNLAALEKIYEVNSWDLPQ